MQVAEVLTEGSLIGWGTKDILLTLARLTRERDQARAALAVKPSADAMEVAEEIYEMMDNEVSDIMIGDVARKIEVFIAGAYREAAERIQKTKDAITPNKGSAEVARLAALQTEIAEINPAVAIRAEKRLVAQAVVNEVIWWKDGNYTEEMAAIRVAEATAALEAIEKETPNG
jgi:hypothetical protein